MNDIIEADGTLGKIAAEQFNEAEAGKYIAEDRQAAENLVRSDPSSEAAWGFIGGINHSASSRSFRLGHVDQAIQEARAALEWHPEGIASSHLGAGSKASLCGSIATWEAQRGDRAAAEGALQEYARYQEADGRFPSGEEAQLVAKLVADNWVRGVKLAFGEDADVETMAANTLQLLKDNEGRLPLRNTLLPHFQAVALLDLAEADIHLRRYAQAEAAARALLALRLHDYGGNIDFVFRIVVYPWGEVLLAQAEAGQAHSVEAMKTLEPVIAQLRQLQARGVDNVPFRQVFARAALRSIAGRAFGWRWNRSAPGRVERRRPIVAGPAR